MDLGRGNWRKIDRTDVEFGRQIGGGGAGVVYQGWYKGEAVALKALFDPRVSEQLAREFVDELVSMSKLEHRNIVTFVGACVEPTDMFFVMELCETSLYEMIHIEQRSLSQQTALRIALDVASAMEYLHNLQPCIIHRDLKTQNVLLAQSGVAKLCDFGLVRSTNVSAGTPAYMAPELLMNRSFSRLADVYSFGILVWELIAQKFPFFGFEIDDIKTHVCQGERPPFPHQALPAGLVELVNRCWSGDPSLRPEFSNILDQLWTISSNVPKETATEILEGKDSDALDQLLGL